MKLLFINLLNYLTSDRHRDETIINYGLPFWFYILVGIGQLSLVLWFRLIGCIIFKIITKIKLFIVNHRGNWIFATRPSTNITSNHQIEMETNKNDENTIDGSYGQFANQSKGLSIIPSERDDCFVRFKCSIHAYNSSICNQSENLSDSESE